MNISTSSRPFSFRRSRFRRSYRARRFNRRIRNVAASMAEKKYNLLDYDPTAEENQLTGDLITWSFFLVDKLEFGVDLYSRIGQKITAKGLFINLKFMFKQQAGGPVSTPVRIQILTNKQHASVDTLNAGLTRKVVTFFRRYKIETAKVLHDSTISLGVGQANQTYNFKKFFRLNEVLQFNSLGLDENAKVRPTNRNYLILCSVPETQKSLISIGGFTNLHFIDS